MCVCVYKHGMTHMCVSGCVPPRTAFVHLCALVCLRHMHLTMNVLVCLRVRRYMGLCVHIGEA